VQIVLKPRRFGLRQFERDFSGVTRVADRQSLLQQRLDSLWKTPRAPREDFQQMIAAPQQMRVARLLRGLRKPLVRPPAVAGDFAAVIGSDGFGCHVESSARADEIKRRLWRHEDVQPLQFATDSPAGFIRHAAGTLAHGDLNFFVGAAATLGGTQHNLR